MTPEQRKRMKKVFDKEVSDITSKKVSKDKKLEELSRYKESVRKQGEDIVRDTIKDIDGFFDELNDSLNETIDKVKDLDEN